MAYDYFCTKYILLKVDIIDKSFKQLFTDYHEGFIRFANSYVRDMSVAEDFTTDALIYYWENRNRLPDDTNVPAYVLTTIKHKCLNYLQHIQVKEKVNTALLSDAQWELSTRIATLKALEPTELYTEEIKAMVNKALDTLPEKTKIVFMMSRFEHLSNKEIAARLDIGLKSVESHITRALKLLKTELKDYFPLFLFLLENNLL